MRPLPFTALVFTLGLLLGGCSSQSSPSSAAKKSEDLTTPKNQAPESIDLSLLLGMSYDEAASMVAEKTELASGIKIAADKIEVLKKDATSPVKVRATGHVFVQVNDALPYTALCQEALINDDDIILRGRPATKRGVSLIEGISDVTMFYMVGTRLRVIGRHKISAVAPQRAHSSDSLASNFGNSPLPFPDAGPWKISANPLLPPLEEDSVPNSLRTEMRKAAEAEAVLQKSRQAVAPAFPEKNEDEKP